MSIRKAAAVLMAALCLAGAVSCGSKNEESGKSESKPDISVSISENGVSELIVPKEDSEEYHLGNYRISADGVKLYYDEAEFSTDIMLAFERYFLSFQNDDFAAYKDMIYPDYAERYEEYLRNNKDYEYGLDGSFALRRDGLKTTMENMVKFASDEAKEFTGDYTVTRMKIEPAELGESASEEDMIKSFFESYDSIFDLNYYDLVTGDVDKLHLMSFYVFAKGEDGVERSLVGGSAEQQGPRIVFAEKDGKFYTFG